MLRTIVLVALIIVTYGQISSVTAQNQGDAAIEGIRKQVSKIDRKDKGRIVANLRNGKRIKGTIVAVGTDDFTVTEQQTNTAVRIAYAEVKSTGRWMKKSQIRLFLLGAGVLIYTAIVFPR